MERSGERLWGAIREENKLAFFLPEWVNIMDLCISMGPPAARELYPISETINTKLSAYSVCSSEPDRREGERARDKERNEVPYG